MTASEPAVPSRDALAALFPAHVRVALLERQLAAARREAYEEARALRASAVGEAETRDPDLPPR